MGLLVFLLSDDFNAMRLPFLARGNLEYHPWYPVFGRPFVVLASRLYGSPVAFAWIFKLFFLSC